MEMVWRWDAVQWVFIGHDLQSVEGRQLTRCLPSTDKESGSLSLSSAVPFDPHVSPRFAYTSTALRERFFAVIWYVVVRPKRPKIVYGKDCRLTQAK
jgi:hypothetical protein